MGGNKVTFSHGSNRSKAHWLPAHINNTPKMSCISFRSCHTSSSSHSLVDAVVYSQSCKLSGTQCVTHASVPFHTHATPLFLTPLHLKANQNNSFSHSRRGPVKQPAIIGWISLRIFYKIGALQTALTINSLPYTVFILNPNGKVERQICVGTIS